MFHRELNDDMRCICDVFDIGYRCPTCVLRCSTEGHAPCFCGLPEHLRDVPLVDLFSVDEFSRSGVIS